MNVAERYYIIQLYDKLWASYYHSYEWLWSKVRANAYDVTFGIQIQKLSKYTNTVSVTPDTGYHQDREVNNVQNILKKNTMFV